MNVEAQMVAIQTNDHLRRVLSPQKAAHLLGSPTVILFLFPRVLSRSPHSKFSVFSSHISKPRVLSICIPLYLLADMPACLRPSHSLSLPSSPYALSLTLCLLSFLCSQVIISSIYIPIYSDISVSTLSPHPFLPFLRDFTTVARYAHLTLIHAPL